MEYDGGAFVGWQRQDNGLGVQQAVEEAIVHFCGERPTVFGAGRTDSGVHAVGQVAHFDLVKEMAADTVGDALNFHLKPAPVCVRDAAQVDSDFHARFSARQRVYRYRIANRRPPLVLERGRAWRVPTPLDAEAMDRAARMLVGRHDFSTFRAVHCQARSPVRTLDGLSVRRHDDQIDVVARARSFLHRQVRNLVGTLALVGRGTWTADDLARALAAKDRTAGGPTAPAEGLYFQEVIY